MVIHEMIPWRKGRQNVAVRGGDSDFPLTALQRRMNRMFDDFFGDFSDLPAGPLSALTRHTGAFVPRMDVSETDKDITITAELAGMDEKDVEVTMTDDVLTIKGEKKTEHEEKDQRRFVSERSYGTFSRSIVVPDNVETDSIDASFKKGILTVKLNKIPVEEPKAKKIEIKTE